MLNVKKVYGSYTCRECKAITQGNSFIVVIADLSAILCPRCLTDFFGLGEHALKEGFVSIQVDPTSKRISG